MSFLAPGALALLALLPLVVALHAFRSGRHRTASLFLWRKVAATREGRSAGRRIPWRRPRLWLHLAIVTATVLALAGPTGGGGHVVEHRIVLLDASHAMRATDVEPTRFGASLAWLRRTIERAPEREVLTIVRVGHEATLVAARRPAGAELAARVAGLRPDDTTPAWGDAVALAAAVSNPAEATQVQIVSTGETRDAIDAALHDSDPELTADVQRFTVAGSGPNVGLANVTVRPAASPAGRWVVEGDVHASGVDPGTTVDVQVRYRSMDATSALPWAETEVDVGPDERVSFEVIVDLPGIGWVEVRTVQGGVHPVDDAVWHVVDPGTVPTRVAVVGPPDPAVLAALAAIDGVRTVPLDALPTERDAPPFDVVIATGPGVDPGTGSVLWLGEPPSTYVRGAAISTTTPRTVAPGHPLMREVDATDLGLDTVTPLRLPDGARPLVGMEGNVLAWSRTTDVGRQVAVGFGTDDGDWAARPSFPAFVASFVAWARSTPVSEGWACAVARPCPLPTSAYGGGWRIVDASGDTMATGDALYGVEEAGIDRVWPPGAFSHAFTPTRAGPYELRFADGTVVPLAAYGATARDRPGSVDADGASGRPLPDVAGDGWAAWRWWLAIAAGLLGLDAVIVLRDARRAWAGPARAPSTRWLAGVALGVGAVLPALMALALVPSLLATPAATWVSIRTPWSEAVPAEGGPFGRRATWRTVDVVVGSPVVDSGSWKARTDAVVATLPEAIEVGAALHRGSGPLHVDARALDTRDVPVEDAVAWRRRVAGGSTTVRVSADAQVAPSGASSLRIDVPDAPRAGGAYALDVAFAPRTSATSLEVVDAGGQVVHEVELPAGARR
ncbi:MAG: BatA domain-containing protein, partial [Trueperaceae bacterium]|nr:BatA domain-containing protein [Trueperaceae bacterium]